MTQDELKLVLDALKWCHGGEPCGTAEAIAVVEKALAQPEQFCDANCVWTDHHPDCKLAQPQQEPVAWMYQEYRDDDQFGWRDEILFTPPPNDPNYFRNIVPVYTTPPQRTEICCQQYDICLKPCTPRGRHLAQRTWVGLTDDEISNMFDDWPFKAGEFARAIEAKLKERNT